MSTHVADVRPYRKEHLQLQLSQKSAIPSSKPLLVAETLWYKALRRALPVAHPNSVLHCTRDQTRQSRGYHPLFSSHPTSLPQSATHRCYCVGRKARRAPLQQTWQPNTMHTWFPTPSSFTMLAERTSQQHRGIPAKPTTCPVAVPLLQYMAPAGQYKPPAPVQASVCTARQYTHCQPVHTGRCTVQRVLLRTPLWYDASNTRVDKRH
jgi:hypothetical protein